jgi:glycosyltransferase involved in cell wall biosynthesis
LGEVVNPTDAGSAPQVTVLMPIFNGETHVAEAVESILGQTFRDFEFLIIDDGSTDGGTAIIEGYGDSRIRLVRNDQNAGLIRALNQGLGLSRGKYIARFDADDISLPERLKRQVEFLEANPEVGACGTWVRTIGDHRGETWRFPDSADEIRCRLLFDASLAHPSVCMRREMFERHDLQFDEGYPLAEDYQLWKSAGEKFPLSNVGEVLVHYRVHAKSVSQQWDQQQETTLRRIHEESLSNLGLTPSDDEHFVHRWIAMGGPQGEALQMCDVESWLGKLLLANANHSVYPRAAFERVLGDFWLMAAYRAVACGRFKPAVFLGSPLSRLVDFGDRMRWLAHGVKRRIGLGSQAVGVQEG